MGSGIELMAYKPKKDYSANEINGLDAQAAKITKDRFFWNQNENFASGDIYRNMLIINSYRIMPPSADEVGRFLEIFEGGLQMRITDDVKEEDGTPLTRRVA